MSENAKKSPIGKALAALLLAAGGWAFVRNFEIEGLDQIAVRPKSMAPHEPDDHALDAFLSESTRRPGSTPAASSLYPGSLFPSSAHPGSSASGSSLHRSAGGLPSTSGGGLDVKGTTANMVSHSLGPSSRGSEAGGPARVAAGRAGSIRVGSWALAGFGRDKLAKPHVADLFARLARQFDVLALQQITTPERDLLPRLVEHVNRTGRKYDFLLGPVVSPPGEEGRALGEQYAFLFDTERIETDRGQLYTVADPGEQVSYDPLVGWFRTRGLPPGRAWTFSLVNFRVDTVRASQEVPLLGELMAAVAADGRGEDDLLLCGMLQADDRQLVAELGGEASEAAVRATPTDIFARYQLSNLILPKRTTTEYLGRGGVIDFLRLYNLTSAEAEELSPHLPVFGEFTPSEGD
ncbi:exonuclease/endonuclease/phosphatase family protein [Candidatus Laterigemmans baculatus]|uniref:deoxyribonuclease I n=1 Tax=Candidatus Laterigemmans baculatus TaxID=2770505 RepID=UPI0013DCD48C|nr:deoxyribonuclease I [Candidatus Laterigemmans baculatus]